MTKDINDMIAFYMDDGEGTIRELIIDLFNRYFEHVTHVDKKNLRFVHNSKLKEFCVEDKLFYALFDAAEKFCEGGEYGSEGYSYEDLKIATEKREEKEKQKPAISQEKLWDAINWQIDKDSLHKILSYDFRYEKGDYYNFELMLDKIHRYMAGEVTDSYFNSWCVLMMRCLFEATKCEKIDLQNIYEEIADYLDGFAFGCYTSEKEKHADCRELIAELKYYNHQIEDIKRGKTTDFEKNGVIVHVAFTFTLSGGYDCAYYMCIVDKRKKLINYTVVYNLDFDEEISYTILSEAEFSRLSSDYFDDYKLDTSLTADCQKRK